MTHDDTMKLLALLGGRGRDSVEEPLSFEKILCDDAYFGLTTATPLQRAVTRVAQGGVPLDDLLSVPLVPRVEAYPPEIQERATWEWSLGPLDTLRRWTSVVPAAPRELYLISSIRSGKSLMAAACAVGEARRARLDMLRDGETPRLPVVSTSRDNAQAIHEHLRSMAERPIAAWLSDRTRRDLEDDSRRSLEDIEVSSRDGRPVAIRVAAGARAGSSLVARWLVAAIFDEAPRMLSSEDGVVNLDDQLRSIRGRMLGPIWCLGSPWSPHGAVYDAYQAHAGQPSPEVVVIRGVGPALNPTWWTPERCWELRTRDPDAYATDVCGEFAAASSAAYPTTLLDTCTRSEPVTLPRLEGVTYYAVMDPATRGNAWALTIGGVYPDGVLRQAMATEWLPDGARLDPEVVLREVAQACAEYGVTHVVTDQWASDALASIGRRVGLTVVEVPATTGSNTEESETFRTRLAAGEVELSPLRQVQSDLRRGYRVPRPEGGWRYRWPQTGDGRHCDLGAATVRLMAYPSPAAYEEPIVDPLEHLADEERRHIEAAQARVRSRMNDDWSYM